MENNYIMNTYSRFPIVLEKGDGMYVYDDKNKKYLDFVAGIAVNCLGHGNEDLAKALYAQASNIIHCSNLYYTNPQLKYAKTIIENSCFDKIFFCNSGAEAIEASIKLARKHGFEKGKTEIIAMENSFHGRTLGALSTTGQEKYQKYFRPLLPDVSFAKFNDLESLKEKVTSKTAAILIEPIQGEGGILPASLEYLQGLRKICDENDILLIFDEIQCGIGRTGNLFAYEHYGVEPDICAVAKGIAGGVACGAMLAKASCSNSFNPGDHASTFGGNPLALSGANVVIDYLLNKGLLDNVKRMSAYLNETLNKLKNEFPNVVKDVRGVGLMMGIELSVPTGDIINKCIEDGILIVGSGNNTIRFVPPFILEKEHIDEAYNIIYNIFKNL